MNASSAGPALLFLESLPIGSRDARARPSYPLVSLGEHGQSPSSHPREALAEGRSHSTRD